MFCPRCKAEYIENMVQCPDCQVPLQDHPEPDAPTDSFELVTVFITSNKALLAVAKSILDSEHIQYLVKGEYLQELFGVGTLGYTNLVVGPIEIQVSQKNAPDALELLHGLSPEVSP